MVLPSFRHTEKEISSFKDDECVLEKKAYKDGSRTPAKIKLANTLWFMEGGSVNDISLNLHLGAPLVHKMFSNVVCYTNRRLSLPTMPKTEVEMENAALTFFTSRTTLNHLAGCISAVDGINVALEKLKKIYNPSEFFCGKGYYAAPVQAMVDLNYRFRAVSAFCYGATHDSVVLRMSNRGKYVQEGNALKGFWVVAGDEAYLSEYYFLSPLKQAILVLYTNELNLFINLRIECTWNKHLVSA